MLLCFPPKGFSLNLKEKRWKVWFKSTRLTWRCGATPPRSILNLQKIESYCWSASGASLSAEPLQGWAITIFLAKPKGVIFCSVRSSSAYPGLLHTQQQRQPLFQNFPIHIYTGNNNKHLKLFFFNNQFFDKVSQNQLATAVEYDDQWRGPLTTFAKFFETLTKPWQGILGQESRIAFHVCWFSTKDWSCSRLLFVLIWFHPSMHLCTGLNTLSIICFHLQNYKSLW